MKEIDMVATGNNLKAMCEDKGYDAKALSILLNVTLSAPYYWFQGKVLPRVDTFVRLCGLIDCKFEDVLVLINTDDHTEESEEDE